MAEGCLLPDLSQKLRRRRRDRRTDELVKAAPEQGVWRPAVGIAPRITDVEMVTLSVMQALLGFTSGARWLRYARVHLRHLLAYQPRQLGYNKRLRRLGTMIGWLAGVLARDTTLLTDDVWVVDSTPVKCAHFREAAPRWDLAGWAEYGYCASHSGFLWALRLHLLCTLHGLDVGFALTGAKADERHTLLRIFDADPGLTSGRAGQIVIGDKNYFGREFETTLTGGRARAAAPGPQGRDPMPGSPVLHAVTAVI